MIRKQIASRWMQIRPAELNDADNLAELHALATPIPWSSLDFAQLIETPNNRSWMAEVRWLGRSYPIGALLCSIAADEAEILNLFIAPKWRRSGIAAKLLKRAQNELFFDGARSWNLEVAEDNQPALSLYKRFGFAAVGRRHAYYKHLTKAKDALILRRALP